VLALAFEQAHFGGGGTIQWLVLVWRGRGTICGYRIGSIAITIVIVV